jgi:hypothetical protein
MCSVPQSLLKDIFAGTCKAHVPSAYLVFNTPLKPINPFGDALRVVNDREAEARW